MLLGRNCCDARSHGRSSSKDEELATMLIVTSAGKKSANKSKLTKTCLLAIPLVMPGMSPGLWCPDASQRGSTQGVVRLSHQHVLRSCQLQFP